MKKKNEIDQKRFELEERGYKDSKELQKDKRNISPADHEYEYHEYDTTKGEKTKNKYQERTMEMYSHYEDEEIMKWNNPKYKENHLCSHMTISWDPLRKITYKKPFSSQIRNKKPQKTE